VAPELNGASRRPIVPLIWDKVDDAHARTPEECALLAKLRTHQILTWDQLQYEDWASPAPNKAAGKLAEELEPKLRS
jgi:hypothetical protein